MTDANLRALERAAQQDPSQRAAYLWERVRRGDLSRERLELAAYCGDEGARSVVNPADLANDWGHCREDDEQPDHCESCSWWVVHQVGCPAGRLPAWLQGLSRWGPEVQVRAGLAAAEVALPVWELSQGFRYQASDDSLRCIYSSRAFSARLSRTWAPRRALGAVRAWLEDPSEANRERWYQAQWVGGIPEWVPFCGDRDVGPVETHAFVLGVRSAAQATSEPKVREAIQRGLIAWALS